MVARLLWEQDAAGSSPVTSTTRKQGEQRSPCFLVVEIGYKRVIFLQDLPAKAIAPTGFDSAMLHSR